MKAVMRSRNDAVTEPQETKEMVASAARLDAFATQARHGRVFATLRLRRTRLRQAQHDNRELRRGALGERALPGLKPLGVLRRLLFRRTNPNRRLHRWMLSCLNDGNLRTPNRRVGHAVYNRIGESGWHREGSGVMVGDRESRRLAPRSAPSDSICVAGGRFWVY